MTNQAKPRSTPSALPARTRVLASIKRRTQRIRAAQDDLEAAVRKARATGCTWAQIGDALGTTRSAAEQRFHNIGADRPLR